MEDVKKAVAEVMQAFTEQELGNKITQFNMQGLVMVLLAKIDEAAAPKEETKKK